MFPLLRANILKNMTFSASGKMRVLERMLTYLREGSDEKIVLVSNYTSTLDLLQNVLSGKGYSFLRLDGSTPAAKRQELVDKFNRVDADAACINPSYILQGLYIMHSADDCKSLSSFQQNLVEQVSIWSGPPALYYLTWIGILQQTTRQWREFTGMVNTGRSKFID